MELIVSTVRDARGLESERGNAMLVGCNRLEPGVEGHRSETDGKP